MKILVVDDDDLMLQSIAHTLKEDGFDVVTANDGEKAFKIIKKKELDLIVSDILMPNMSGLGLLNMVEKHYDNRLPIIFMSSLHKNDPTLTDLNQDDIEFMEKPINFEDLVIRIRKYI
jgi:DNA-binding response OmpR family regulator